MTLVQKESVIQVICKDRPELGKLFVYGKGISIENYYRETSHITLPRNSDIVDIISQIITQRLPHLDKVKLADLVGRAFQDSYRVGTADHHGPIGHPFFFHNAIIEHIIHPERPILLLPCSGVSLSNSSFPRGLLLHDENGNLARIPFFTNEEGKESVYGKKVSIIKIKGLANKNIEKLKLTEERKSRLSTLIEEILPTEYNKTYEELIIYINERLWEKLVGESGMYIAPDQESVVIECIMRDLEHNGILTTKLFCCETNVKEYINAFDGIIGAWNTTEKKGSHIFWFRNKAGRIPLWYKKGKLINNEYGVEIDLSDKNQLRTYLERKELYPTMALSFTILTGIHGLRADGGFSQINYLKEMLDSYKNLQRHNIFEKGELPNPSIFRGELGVMPFQINGKIVQATLLDLLIYAPEDWKDRVQRYIETKTLSGGLEPMLEEFYKITTKQPITISDVEKPTPLWIHS